MFPPPTSLSLAIHAELAKNSDLSSLPLKQAVKRQKAEALMFFNTGKEVQEEFIDSAGVVIKRKVMGKYWQEMIKDMKEWELDGEPRRIAGEEVMQIEA